MILMLVLPVAGELLMHGSDQEETHLVSFDPDSRIALLLVDQLTAQQLKPKAHITIPKTPNLTSSETGILISKSPWFHRIMLKVQIPSKVPEPKS